MGKRVATITAIVAGIAIVGGVYWAFATSWVHIGKSGAVATSPNICDDQKVVAYNDARRLVFQDDAAAEPTWNQAALDQLAADIKKTDGYESDATCQTILFWTAYDHQDLQGMQAAYDGIKLLHGKQHFANTNLASHASLEQYESMIHDLSSPEGESVGAN